MGQKVTTPTLWGPILSRVSWIRGDDKGSLSRRESIRRQLLLGAHDFYRRVEWTREMLDRGVIKAEAFFGYVCEKNPEAPFTQIQWICCGLHGMSRSRFREYKRRRKAVGDHRDEWPVSNEDKEKVLKFLEDYDEAPSVKELPLLLNMSEEVFNLTLQSLERARKLTIRDRRFPDNVIRKAVVKRKRG